MHNFELACIYGGFSVFKEIQIRLFVYWLVYLIFKFSKKAPKTSLLRVLIGTNCHGGNPLPATSHLYTNLDFLIR